MDRSERTAVTIAITAVLSVGLVSAQTGSQRKQPALYDFDTVKTFRCDFTESEGRRTTADGVTSPAKRETFNDLVVDNIDYRDRTARFIGNAGSDSVQVLDGKLIVSFLELSYTGNPNVLSIFKGTDRWTGTRPCTRGTPRYRLAISRFRNPTARVARCCDAHSMHDPDTESSFRIP